MRWTRYDIDELTHRDLGALDRLADRLDPILERWFRPTVRGLAEIPDEPVLFVGNHNGGVITPDTWIFCSALAKARGTAAIPFGLGHEVIINVPGVNQLLVPLGAVRASRENALRLFEAGHNVIVYPGGDADAMRPSAKRDEVVFDGRQGYVRLAVEAQVPIVPLVAAGAHAGFYVATEGRRVARLLRADRLFRLKVWPLMFGLPWGPMVAPGLPYLPVPTRILMDVLPPMRFPRGADVGACDRAVREAMGATLRRLAAERRAQPSALRAFFDPV